MITRTSASRLSARMKVRLSKVRSKWCQGLSPRGGFRPNPAVNGLTKSRTNTGPGSGPSRASPRAVLQRPAVGGEEAEVPVGAEIDEADAVELRQGEGRHRAGARGGDVKPERDGAMDGGREQDGEERELDAAPGPAPRTGEGGLDVTRDELGRDRGGGKQRHDARHLEVLPDEDEAGERAEAEEQDVAQAAPPPHGEPREGCRDDVGAKVAQERDFRGV